MDLNTISLLNEQLVTDIRHYVQDEAILGAFRAVPRHVFVPQFYDRVQPNAREWTLVSRADHEEEWQRSVYTNRPLTISLDENQYPESSSSHPGIMASMLQSVRLRPGSRVLEIGTGTGYNAALVACLVGPSQLVSIDINEALLDVARERITRIVGPGVRVEKADGRHLPADLGDFDAIIVTGAHEQVEPSWIHALAPGGWIVFNWAKSVTKVMIEAQKSESDGQLFGHVCAYGGDFMPLHDGGGVKYPALPSEPLDLIACLDVRAPFFEDPDFGFFLQIHLPSLHVHRYRRKAGERSYAVKEMKSQRIVRFSPGSIRGDGSLWEEIHPLYETYEQLLKPSRKAFSLIVDEHGAMTFTYKEHTFRVPSSS